jgi:cardiolipin synthase A/B
MKLTRKRAAVWISIVALAVFGLWIFLSLFGPTLKYQLTTRISDPVDSEEFLQKIAILTDSRPTHGNRFEVLTNGPAFYEAELEAIRGAQRSVNIEAYIFSKGEIARRFLDALTERARAGVKVNLIVDGVGALGTAYSFFEPLTSAGGKVEFYHPIRFYTVFRYNNRTHRELLIIDGKLGFIGGAGIADHWMKPQKKNPMWRDTMGRVEGEAVSGLQGTFVENWLEASGELLTGPEYLVPLPTAAAPDGQALVVASAPSPGSSTRGRTLFQVMLAAADRSIHINSPYFLPDESLRNEIIAAMKRGAEVKIIVPGKHTDHTMTRRSSRRLFGELLKAGAEIYEYEASMIHVKMMLIDGKWSVVGSTNFDPRSFSLNDEVNLATADPHLAARLEEDFQTDLKNAKKISHEEWQRRPIWERVHEWFGAILERQQ